MTILIESNPDASAQYANVIGEPLTVVDGWPGLAKEVDDRVEEMLVVIGPDEPIELALAFAEAQRLTRPALGVVLLRRRLDVKVLASALRAGVREVLVPDDTAAVREACERSLEVSRRTAGWQPSEHARPEGRVITVFAAKGGCGKTTVATNLAATLAEGGKRRVCLVDLDLSFGDVAIAMQLFPTRSMSDAVVMRDGLDEEGVRSLITPHSPGLDTLLAPLEPGDAEKIPTSVVTEVLSVLRRTYDYVVVDTPPDFKEWVLAALDVSDFYVLLATLDIPALKNLRLTLDMLSLLNYPRENWQIVLNRSDSKVGLDIADVEKTLKMSIAAQVPSSRAVSASINKGIPLVLEQPNHPISQALRRFVDSRILTAAETAASAEGSVEPRVSVRRGFGIRRKAVAR